MCAVLDLCGKVVLNWKIGSEMSSSLVTDTIREALQQEKVTDGLALHSDQGSQYTSQAYFDLTKAYLISPSGTVKLYAQNSLQAAEKRVVMQ